MIHVNFDEWNNFLEQTISGEKVIVKGEHTYELLDKDKAKDKIALSIDEIRNITMRCIQENSEASPDAKIVAKFNMINHLENLENALEPGGVVYQAQMPKVTVLKEASNPLQSLFHIALQGKKSSEVTDLAQRHEGTILRPYSELRQKYANELEQYQASQPGGYLTLQPEDMQDLKRIQQNRANLTKYVQIAMKAKRADPSDPAFIQYLEAVQANINHLDLDHSDDVIQLPDGTKSFVILGGWPGHYLSYEIQKKPDGQYLFIIHNQGEAEDLNLLHGETEFHIDGTDFYKTTIQIKLSIDDLKNTQLIQKILHRHVSGYDSKGHYKDIYELLVKNRPDAIIKTDVERQLDTIHAQLQNPYLPEKEKAALLNIAKELIQQDSNFQHSQFYGTCGETNANAPERAMASTKVRLALKFHASTSLIDEIRQSVFNTEQEKSDATKMIEQSQSVLEKWQSPKGFNRHLVPGKIKMENPPPLFLQPSGYLIKIYNERIMNEFKEKLVNVDLPAVEKLLKKLESLTENPIEFSTEIKKIIHLLIEHKKTDQIEQILPLLRNPEEKFAVLCKLASMLPLEQSIEKLQEALDLKVTHKDELFSEISDIFKNQGFLKSQNSKVVERAKEFLINLYFQNVWREADFSGFVYMSDALLQLKEFDTAFNILEKIAKDNLNKVVVSLKAVSDDDLVKVMPYLSKFANKEDLLEVMYDMFATDNRLHAALIIAKELNDPKLMRAIQKKLIPQT